MISSFCPIARRHVLESVHQPSQHEPISLNIDILIAHLYLHNNFNHSRNAFHKVALHDATFNTEKVRLDTSNHTQSNNLSKPLNPNHICLSVGHQIHTTSCCTTLSLAPSLKKTPAPRLTPSLSSSLSRRSRRPSRLRAAGRARGSPSGPPARPQLAAGAEGRPLAAPGETEATAAVS